MAGFVGYLLHPGSSSVRAAAGSAGSVSTSSHPQRVAATGSDAPGSSSTAAAASTPLVGTGVYVDGGVGTPHYFVVLNTSTASSIGGSVDFVYQDGQTSVVFTFRGTVGDDGTVATLTPLAVPQHSGSASQPPGSIPSALSATLAHGSISLGECTSYLHFAPSEAACTFSASSSIQ
ncbi:hypothetical protein [Aciditerrimonas ferrireducens]|uniref:hypothetical protein n=1 Tax=Aciditerrimonas ferrireducens TaxID=667306 RepID=UPI002003D83F|nr:hypothetical protein [Aciditerrimonas ferrireducens]MCK4177898.1 hypothetical protein [Aciditerrimonas ferrireducens]